ncbi:MAG: hypothetical protein VX694_10055 [Planctomycetota bacterium]|nr:hypothetical protein [Planctomycetota bacterium]
MGGLPVVGFLGSSRLMTLSKRRTRNDTSYCYGSLEKINAMEKESPLAKVAQLGKMCRKS